MVITRSEWALDLGGAKGSRTPDLLHAMQQEQRYGLGLDGVYLDLLCTGVPVSACKSVCVGCPLGCPLVSDCILLTRPASLTQQFQTAIKTIATYSPGPQPRPAAQQHRSHPDRQSTAAAEFLPLMPNSVLTTHIFMHCLAYSIETW